MLLKDIHAQLEGFVASLQLLLTAKQNKLKKIPKRFAQQRRRIKNQIRTLIFDLYLLQNATEQFDCSLKGHCPNLASSANSNIYNNLSSASSNHCHNHSLGSW